MKKFFLIISMLGLIFMSCKKETTLSGSYIIPDPANPSLPIYSESGYNTFGAMFDDNSMTKSQYQYNSGFVYITTDTMSVFKMNFVLYPYGTVAIDFKLKDMFPSNYAELLALAGKTYNFKEPNSSFALYRDGTPVDYQLIDGEIEFHKAQPFRIDEIVSGTVLSGYFSMKFIVDNQPHSIYDGRFDVSVQDHNFYDLREK